MLTGSVGNVKPTVGVGFLLCVEIEEGGPSHREVCNKLGDALSFVEGIGQVQIECLGVIDTVEVDETGSIDPSEGDKIEQIQ